MENLSKKTFFAYAIHTYNNPSCGGMAEFKEDLLRLKYIKRLIKKYVKTGELKPRLLLNHLIGLSNVFKADAISRMLFYRIDKSGWSALKTILDYLNLMPAIIPMVNGIDVISANIPRDNKLLALIVGSIELQSPKP